MSQPSSRGKRRSWRPQVVACLVAVSAAAVFATASVASAHTMARAKGHALLSASVHPPTFDNTKLIGIRNALSKAMKGKSLSSVNTWMVVNILATYWVAGKDGNAAAAKELGVAGAFRGPVTGPADHAVVDVQHAWPPMVPTACSPR